MLQNNIRYTKQRYKNDCGLASVANIIKYSGIPFSYRHHFNELSDLLNFDFNSGICLTDLINYFKEQSLVKYKFKISPSIKELKKQLKKGVVLLTYRNKNNSYHSVLVIRDYNFGFTIIGEYSGKDAKKFGNMPYYFMEEMLEDSYAFFVAKK